MLYENRPTQLDLRLSKLVKIGSGARLDVNLDMFNALNSAAILAVNSAFGPQWRRPTTILTGRLIELSGRVNF